MRIALVSGADANYFPLLLEWVHSIRRFQEATGFEICIRDAGLTTSQKETLGPDVTSIKAPDWPLGIPQKKVAGREYLKACVCRPFVRELFPGYDVYVWMDSDTWVQDWSAVEMFIAGAARGDRITVTTGADRSLHRQINIRWLGRIPLGIRNFYYSHGKKVYGPRIATQLLNRYTIFAGCFALSAHAPHWDRWQQLVTEAASKGDPFPAEQLSLGKLIYIEGYKAELLPTYAHWICATRPKYDVDSDRFVEPYLPHMPLGILHLSGVDAMRADRNVREPFGTIGGNTVEKNCRYPLYDAGPVAKERCAR